MQSMNTNPFPAIQANLTEVEENILQLQQKLDAANKRKEDLLITARTLESLNIQSTPLVISSSNDNKAGGSIRERVILFFTSNPEESSVKDVVTALGKDGDVFYPSVASDISRLKRDGVLEQASRGVYRLAQKGESPGSTEDSLFPTKP